MKIVRKSSVSVEDFMLDAFNPLPLNIYMIILLSDNQIILTLYHFLLLKFSVRSECLEVIAFIWQDCEISFFQAFHLSNLNQMTKIWTRVVHW